LLWIEFAGALLLDLEDDLDQVLGVDQSEFQQPGLFVYIVPAVPGSAEGTP